MANEYFQPGSVPAPNSPGSSAIMRQEFSSISAGFDKLPVLAGHSFEIITVDGTGTRLIASGQLLPDLVTLDGVQTLTNKTIAWADNTFPGFNRFLTRDGVETVTNKTIAWADNTFPGFNTGATKVAGTLADNVLLLAENNKLPALDGSLLTNLNEASIGVVSIAHGGTGGSTLAEAQTNLGIDLKADANNAVLTGAPTAPTPPTGDNSARIATTYFVTNTIQDIGSFAPSNASPLMNGVASAGVGALGSRDDHVHPTDTSRAPLNSPAFTGTPTAPTPAAGDNDTSIATTAFVNAEIAADRPYSDTNPLMDGTAAQGTSPRVSRQDHRHPTDTSRAPLASPAFTGTPTAPTPLTSTNTTQIATTAFVQSLISQQPPAGMQPSDTNPLMNGTVSPGTGVEGSRYDHVHPTDTSRFAVNGGNITGATSIGVATSTPALRVTQTGTGEAFRVEDSANPDATPFVVTAGGNVGVGGVPTQQGLSVFKTGNYSLMLKGDDYVSLRMESYRESGSDHGQLVTMCARGTEAAPAFLQSGDKMVSIRASGWNGTAFSGGSFEIIGVADGLHSATSQPGRIIFSTTAAGSTTPAERMWIDNAGRVGIGQTAINTGTRVHAGGLITGNTNSQIFRAEGSVQSDATNAGRGYVTIIGTAAAAFTLNQLTHFEANQGVIGAGSVVTTQIGFAAQATLVGGTNNYGFYSSIPAGANNYNFYSPAASAQNFFGGPTVMQVSSTSDALRITQTGAGNSLVVEDSVNPDGTPFVIDGSGYVVIGKQTQASIGGSSAPLQVWSAGMAAISVARFVATGTSGPYFLLHKSRSTTLTGNTIVQNGDDLGTIQWSGDDGVSQNTSAAFIRASVEGVPAASDIPSRIIFATKALGVAGPNERLRITSTGAISIGAGGNTDTALQINRGIFGAVNSYGVRYTGLVAASVTTGATIFSTVAATEPATTIQTLNHFVAGQGTFGAGSVVKEQRGFIASGDMIGATEQTIGFLSAIPAGGVNRWNFQAIGTAPNLFNGAVILGSAPTAPDHATRKDYVDSVAGSDARLKDDVAQLEGGLDLVKRLRGVTFTWNDKLPDPGRVGKESVGVIAQEVALVVPRAIYGDADMLGIEANALSGVLIEAIKELSAKLDTALGRIAELEAKVVA